MRLTELVIERAITSGARVSVHRRPTSRTTGQTGLERNIEYRN